MVQVNTKKLENLVANQSSNVGYCKKTYDRYYKDSVNLILKTGDKIDATTLVLFPRGETTEDTVYYIKNFGADRLNDDQLSIMFLQKTDDPDQCMFFAMKDMGMDKIPMYVDKDSYKLGNALGLFN